MPSSWRAPKLTLSKIMNQLDREACEYQVELDEIYLFPKAEHEELISEMAGRYPVPESVIRQHFLSSRHMGEWLRTFWARRLEPTKNTFHDIAPILSRVRHGCAPEREHSWLGDRITLAIMLDDHEFLKEVFRLATKPIDVKQAFQLTRVSYYEAAALDFAGIRIKRHYKVGGGFNFIFEFIS